MTYKEAVEEMKSLANGGVWALEHETASYHSQDSGNVQIHGYLESAGHARADATYQGAIDNVKRMIGLAVDPYDPAPEDVKEVQHEEKG